MPTGEAGKLEARRSAFSLCVAEGGGRRGEGKGGGVVRVAIRR